jgi:hypothetical protein
MNKGLKIVMWVGLGILFVALLGLLTMNLWNWLMPTLFGLPAINLLQTFGLLLLSKILFGFGGKSYGGGASHWKRKKQMYDKFQSMSPEDRERFKNRMKEKWCRWDEKASTENTDTSNG